VFPNPKSLQDSNLLSLLPTDPPTPELSIGTTSEIPPTASSLKENHRFLNILQSVIAEHAHEDPDVISQARAMASTAGGHLGDVQSGNAAGGASDQGGMGGAGRGGWIHVSDQRNPPDYGRIAWPEDIFGSLEVDGRGEFVDGHGNYQPSGTYRIVTREGILGLSAFLRERMVQRLRLEEAAIKN
jgi:hypothetical protein